MRIKNGEELPAFYGHAWYISNIEERVALLIPFNFIVGWFMIFRSKLKLGPRPALNQCDSIPYWFYRSRN